MVNNTDMQKNKYLLAINRWNLLLLILYSAEYPIFEITF